VETILRVLTGIGVAAAYGFRVSVPLLALGLAGRAGVLSSAAAITDLPSVLTWGIALIGGGGAAGLLHGASSLPRLKSTAVTGGAGNPVVSTGELIGALVTSALALLVPVVSAVLLLVVLVWVIRQRFNKHGDIPT
jgi:hypothetical protein